MTAKELSVVKHRRQHWALLPFLVGVLIGLAVSTVILIKPNTDNVTNNIYINIQEDTLRRKLGGRFSNYLDDLEDVKSVRKLSEEVVVKESVYYAVMNNDGGDFNAIKRTWARGIAIDKIDYFTNSENVDESIISLASNELLEIETLKHVCAHKLGTAKWYFMSYSNIYVKPLELEEFLTSIENSQHKYLGKPIKRGPVGRVCMPGPGSMLSLDLLQELCTQVEECSKLKDNLKTECVLGECIRRQLPTVQCVKDVKQHGMFVKFDTEKNGNIMDSKNTNILKRLLTMYPVTDSAMMYSIHQAVVGDSLNKTQLLAQELKRSIGLMTELLPQTDLGLYKLEQGDHIRSEDDINPWRLINSNLIMSCMERNPAKRAQSVWKKELELLNHKSMEYINSREEEKYTFKRLVNVYWKINPLFGIEYVMDFEVKRVSQESDFIEPSKLFRASLMRQFNELEVSPVLQYVSSHRVIIGLVIGEDQVDKFERFMTNIGKLLATEQQLNLIVVQMKGNKETDEIQSIVNEYKSKYTGADVKLVKSHQKLSREHGIAMLLQEVRPSDIVFLSDSDLEFDSGFLDRCRTYPLKGEQVYFPLPFNQIDPQMLKVTNHTKLQHNITQHSGHWLVDTRSIACLYAADIMADLKEEFTLEKVYAKFIEEGYSIVQSLDKGLRRAHDINRKCELELNGESESVCTHLPDSYEHLYLKTELSALLLDHEGEHAHQKY